MKDNTFKNIKSGIVHATLSLDMGNSFIKAIGSIDGKESRAYTQSIYTTDVAITSKDRVECDGTILALGSGKRTLLSENKSERKFIKHQILWAVYNTLGSGVFSLDIVTCLPINGYKASRSEFENKIKDLGTTVGLVNGEQITIYINNVKVQAESYSAIRPLINQGKISLENDTLIIDVGLGTTDVMQVCYDDEENSLNIVAYHTFNIALKDIYEVFQQELFSRGIDVSINEIDRKINSSNPVFRTNKEDYNLLENITDAHDVGVELLTLIKNTFGNIVRFDKVFIGGGSKHLLNSIEHQVANIIEVDDDITYYGNVLGMLESLEA